MKSDASKTLAESVFGKIKRDILTSRFPPGRWLRLDELRETYSVSLSPLREALSRLISTGLVIAEGQRGFRVAEMSSENLIDITKTRIWIEDIALRSAIFSGDRSWEADIIAAMHRLGDKPAVPTNETWETNHRIFHNILVSACTSRSLLAYRQKLFEESDRYRRAGAAHYPGDRHIAAEHQAIVDAVLKRDAATAAKLMQDHLLITMEIVLSFSVGDKSKVSALIKKAREETDVLLGARSHAPICQ
jgi:GntR family transcriptional regulator, carbon starvation induced regulator